MKKNYLVILIIYDELTNKEEIWNEYWYNCTINEIIENYYARNGVRILNIIGYDKKWKK